MKWNQYGKNIQKSQKKLWEDESELQIGFKVVVMEGYT